MRKLNKKQRALLITAAFVLSTMPSFAQTTIWTDGVDDWFTPENWNNGVPNAATGAQINNGGSAQVAIPSAAALNLRLGYNFGDSGTLLVNGRGSLSIMSELLVGSIEGVGLLSITQGGTVTNGEARVTARFGVSRAIVTGKGSTWTSNNALVVDDNGTGTLDITEGGTVAVTRFDAIIGIIGNGVVTVDGKGSTWKIASNLGVGFTGIGALNITNGGSVLTGTVGTIGSINHGTVTVDGKDSAWKIGDYFELASSGGAAILNITNGGTVTNQSYASIACQPIGGAATIIVDGKGSTWTIGHELDFGLGFSGSGAINITNGGSVSTGSFVIVGAPPNTSYAVIVDGKGSTWTMADYLVLTPRRSGQTSLNITDGGSVTTGSYVTIGESGPGSATVTVDGKGSTWTIANGIDVGLNGAGTLTITNGGTVTVNEALASIGTSDDSTGTVTVDGRDSSWTIKNELEVGFVGKGTLNISNGGTVTVNGISSSPDALDDSTGRVRADRKTLAWTIANEFDVLSQRTATSDATANSAFANVCLSPTANGARAISGFGADGVLSVGGNASGPDGVGLLRIEDCGTVRVATVNVWNGGTLAGTGFIGTTGGTTMIQGRLAPDQTLAVSGNLGLDPTATTLLAVSPAIADKIVVEDTAKLNGQLIINFTEGAFTVGAEYTLLQAGGGLGGTTFSNVSINFPPGQGFKPQLIYDTDHVDLFLEPVGP